MIKDSTASGKVEAFTVQMIPPKHQGSLELTYAARLRVQNEMTMGPSRAHYILTPPLKSCASPLA